MKIISKNLKKGVKLKIESRDDLWHLANIIAPGDIVSAKTTRKIKLGPEEKATAVRKTVFIKLKVEAVSFEGDILRIKGTVIEAPEEIPKGAHHSFSLTINDSLTIEKEKWLGFQLKRLDEASAKKQLPILICVHDREKAIFAIAKQKGVEVIATIKGTAPKKGVEEKPKEDFFKRIVTEIQSLAEKHNISDIVIASPAFWREETAKRMPKTLKEKVIFTSCSSATKRALNEVLKRKELAAIFERNRLAREIKAVEMLLEEIAKDRFYAYGIKEVEQAASTGAISLLLVTDNLIKKLQEENRYLHLEKIMHDVELAKGNIMIVASDNEPGKTLDSLGGIGAVLRFKIS